VYGELKEIVPDDITEPLGNFVTCSHYVDANPLHDILTGRSVTGILNLINKTPIESYSKKPPKVETATYGSEFVAATTCVKQIIYIWTTLYYLGVPIRSKRYMIGDNKSVVDSSMQVDAKLHKRHAILSFHRVRENPADILSKHWGYSKVWARLKALFFWVGDTSDIEE
jgi:hypothetical protein